VIETILLDINMELDIEYEVQFMARIDLLTRDGQQMWHYALLLACQPWNFIRALDDENMSIIIISERNTHPLQL